MSGGAALPLDIAAFRDHTSGMPEQGANAHPNPEVSMIPNVTKATVSYDRDWQEYVVKVWVDGARYPAADYHTTDKLDAHDTARAMMRRAA